MGSKQKRRIDRLTQRAAHLQQVCAVMSVGSEYLRDSYQFALSRINQQRESIKQLEREIAQLKSDPGVRSVTVDFNQFRRLLLDLPLHRVAVGTIVNMPIKPIGEITARTESSDPTEIPDPRQISFMSRSYMRPMGRNETRLNAWVLLDKVAIIDTEPREG